jgi:hypothetical protein
MSIAGELFSHACFRFLGNPSFQACVNPTALQKITVGRIFLTSLGSLVLSWQIWSSSLAVTRCNTYRTRQGEAYAQTDKFPPILIQYTLRSARQ